MSTAPPPRRKSFAATMRSPLPNTAKDSKIAAERGDIVPFVRTVVGATDPQKAAPGTIRGDLGRDSLEASMAENRMCENLIHASDSPQAVREEAAIWFSPETCKMYFD